jgi:hypothetical protein
MGRFNFERFPSDATDGVIGVPLSPDWEFRRLATIEEDEVPVDPWQRLSSEPFHLSARQILARARRFIPRDPGASVTDFTSWIYSLHVPAVDERALYEGKESEQQILDLRRLAAKAPQFRSLPDPKWRLLHSGMGERADPVGHVSFEIPSLRVGGRLLRGCPDLVFENQEDGHLVIIEVKFSLRVIPTNLWPNVWAQLWAYSQIPQFAIAPRITVVGEVWGDNSGSWRRRNCDSLIYLRRTVKRDPRTPVFKRFFAALFEIYGGSARKEPGETSAW